MSLKENLDEIERRIEDACSSAGRKRSEVTLVAVTKTVPIEKIREAYDLGCRDFGESRLQEALPKIEQLPSDIRWHFIGKLQSNKAKRVAEVFHLIHTLDSESQLREIAKQPRRIDALIEVNVGKEAQKSGIAPGALDEFIRICTHCKEVRLRGLMTIGPALDPENMRPYFRQLKDWLPKVPEADILSMGMSGDFEVAIQEGSTLVRIGSALFGDRA
ncbi:MAG: YggS family pyridoxal phosphate-dependent enzyme [Fimbriimonadaceae bacterium]|nr:YggS family pyridoxal phosphate-dependent enzyme [Fimbriimonadaceae bacterium]